MVEACIDTSVLIVLSCREREIPYIASFDRDFDSTEWLRRLALPEDLV